MLRMMGQIAGIGGLAICVFLLLFRNIIGKAIFPKLTKEQAYKLLNRIVFLIFLLAIVGIASWTFVEVLSKNSSNTQNLNNTRWKEVSVFGYEQNRKIIWEADWRDIYWLSNREGWLCGVIREGGGYGDIGIGRLLHTINGGETWNEVREFPAGQGEFTWGPKGSREYTWNNIGPMYSIQFTKRFLGSDDFIVEGLLATATGIYYTQDGGTQWKRMTPPPDHPDRYAFFFRIADIENFGEIYAVGWQGIAHWPTMDGGWEVQMPTYDHEIVSIYAVGGSENRNVWAVGRAGVDDQIYGETLSHGAIYHLDWPANRWKKMPLPGVEFELEQTLWDILLIDKETTFAVGQKGLIIHGSRKKNHTWVWSKLPKKTDESLVSITYDGATLWILGEYGVILKSIDKGNHWTKLNIIKNVKETPVYLRHIRFFNNQGWIVGKDIVLKLER